MKNPEWIREGEEIRRLREAMGLSRSQLAARLGVSETTIKSVEYGTQRMGARTFRKMEEISAVFRHDGSTERQPLVVSEEAVSYAGTRNPPSSEPSIQQVIRIALQSSGDEKVRMAAKTLADAAGISYEDALAVVVEQRIKNG